MAQFKNVRKVELSNGTAPVVNLGQIYYGDVEANRIGAIVFLDGAPVTLTGTCSGTAILADGSTVPLTGALEGNMAYVDLTSSCYSKEGQIRVFVKLTVSGVTTTLIAAVGTVRLTETDTVIDPGTIIPSVAALIDDIEDAIESIPADYSALLATIAPNYSDLTFPVSVGQWCWYSGVLYAANQDISTSENWTAAHWHTVTVGGEVSELKSAFNITEHKSANLLNINAIETGCYYWTNGKNLNSAYNSTDFIPVSAGEKIWFQYGTRTVASGRLNYGMRFLTAYDSNKEVITDKCQSNVSNGYEVTEGVAFLIVSVDASVMVEPQNPMILNSDDGTVIDFEEYYTPYVDIILKDSSNNEPFIRSVVEEYIESETNRGIFTAEANNLVANNQLICCANSDNKKNEYIELTANFASFGTLTIAHGKNSYQGSYIEISESKITVYNYDGTMLEEFEHGLSINEFINVIIYTKNDVSCRSSITIMSTGGEYTASTTRYYSSRGSVVAIADFNLTNIKMQYTINDTNEDVWVFGDSYVSIGDPNRWADQMVRSGHKNVLISGFGGARAQDEIPVFREFVDVAKPKYLVWALGMNNADSSGINADWKTCVDEVIETCEEKGIIPILATIPNVPSIDHTYKNNYVRNSDYRYVDFAKAVNAESAGSSWYAGMLSNDNVHPTELGAKALMRQFLIDVPEVLYKEK